MATKEKKQGKKREVQQQVQGAHARLLAATRQQLFHGPLAELGRGLVPR